MSEKHSPGPWRAVRSSRGCWYLLGASGHQVALLGVEGHLEPRNAILAAAAPEMLAALRHTVECEEHLVERCEECHTARNLIKRLDGE